MVRAMPWLLMNAPQPIKWIPIDDEEGHFRRKYLFFQEILLNPMLEPVPLLVDQLRKIGPYHRLNEIGAATPLTEKLTFHF